MQVGASFVESLLVLGEFVLRGGLFCHKFGQRRLRAFKVGDLRLRLLQISSELRYFIGRAARASVLQSGLSGKHILPRLRQLTLNICRIEAQNKLPTMDILPFGDHYFIHEGGKLGASRDWGNRLDLSVAGNGRSQILARHLGDCHRWSLISPRENH